MATLPDVQAALTAHLTGHVISHGYQPVALTETAAQEITDHVLALLASRPDLTDDLTATLTPIALARTCPECGHGTHDGLACGPGCGMGACT